ncbi:MAG: nucleotidyltransferase family protein [Pseudomonadota bacterium]
MLNLGDITAVVLAGGQGTRLRAALPQVPKVLAPVAGRPFLAHLLEQLTRAGLKRAVLCTGYQGDRVRDALGETWGDMALAYSQEEAPLGTGGALRLSLPLLDSPLWLVMNGDSYCGADLAAYARWHQERGAGLSLLLARVENCARFGRVSLQDGGQVLGFAEKDGRNAPGLINAGIYLMERRVIEELPPGRELSLERQVFPDWIGRGLGGLIAPGPFLDIGTPESHARAEGFFGALERP